MRSRLGIRELGERFFDEDQGFWALNDARLVDLPSAEEFVDFFLLVSSELLVVRHHVHKGRKLLAYQAEACDLRLVPDSVEALHRLRCEGHYSRLDEHLVVLLEPSDARVLIRLAFDHS